jgi:hypothetical protein
MQPHHHVLAILTTATLASTNNALPDGGVTAPKHVRAVLTFWHRNLTFKF